MAMRFAVSGCVLKSEFIKPMMPCFISSGWMMNSCATSGRETLSNPGLCSILRSAEANANGLPHSSAPPASAMYSRLREMAKRVSSVKR